MVASGFEHYVPGKGEYGYARLPQVVTLPDFIRWMSAVEPGDGLPELEGRPISSVAFIHCVGSRQADGVNKPQADGKINEYCSRVCCTATLQALCDLQEKRPDVDVFDFYQDIRAYGRGHEDYYEKASRAGAVFVRFAAQEPPRVAKSRRRRSGTPLTVTAKDGLTWGEEVEVGRRPRGSRGRHGAGRRDGPHRQPQAAGRRRPLPPGGAPQAAPGGARRQRRAACRHQPGTQGHHRNGRLGRGRGGEGHGVALDRPRRARPLRRARRCAALRAETSLRRGVPVHGAIEMREYPDGASRAVVNPALCSGCGACVAVCPTRAIDLAGWTLEQYDAMVDALLEGSEAPAR